MSVEIKYICDHCDRKSFVKDNWMEIKAVGNDASLSIENNIHGRSLISSSMYKQMHFCSRECFIDHFFKPIEELLKD